jgi:MFS family permease
MFENKIFKNSILAALLQGLGFLGVVFMLIMYLQGVLGFTPLYASLLLVPGYVVSGILAPFMGRVSDKQGARVVATIGIVLQILGVMVYLFLGPSSSIYIVILGSLITGIGGAMFWPSNSSAVMANADPRRFGIASGLSRLFATMGMMGSFIVVFVVAALSIPRAEAFQIFVGTSVKLSGSIAGAFVTGMRVSFIAMIVILIIAGIISFARGKEDRTQRRHNAQPHVKSPTEEPYAQEPPE